MAAHLVLLLLVAGCLGGGCQAPSGQRKAYNTLYSAHVTADAALKTYYNLVIAGVLPTNSVPRVTAAYGDFQAVFNAALQVVANDPNAPAPVTVVEAMTKLNAIVNEARREGGQP